MIGAVPQSDLSLIHIFLTVYCLKVVNFFLRSAIRISSFQAAVRVLKVGIRGNGNSNNCLLYTSLVRMKGFEPTLF